MDRLEDRIPLAVLHQHIPTLGTRSPNLAASILMSLQRDRWQARLSHQASSDSAISPAVHSLPTSITRLQDWSATLAHPPEQTMKSLC